MAKKAPSGGTPATLALAAAGVPFTLHSYDHDPRVTSFGLEAAQALGFEPEQVFKTLVASVDAPGPPVRTELVVGIVPVSGQLDLKGLARALGAAKATMAEVAHAERTTGYVAGGISPIGQKRRLRTVLDETAELFDTIYVSAGRRGLDLEIAPADLIQVTGAIVADIGR